MDTTSVDTKTEIRGLVNTIPNPSNDSKVGCAITKSAEIVAVDTENLSSDLEMVIVVTEGTRATTENGISNDTRGPSNKSVMENMTISREENVEKPKELVSNMLQRLENIRPPPSYACCIYRIAENIRNLDKEAYTPVMVSIGPYFRGMWELQFTEEYKWRYLMRFLERSGVRLQRFVELMKENEKSARECYAETIDMSSDDFVRMLLLDGCFILEFLLQYFEDDEYILSKEFNFSRIRHDLILLENQIPFFILQALFDQALDPKKYWTSSLYEVICFSFDIHHFPNIKPGVGHVKHLTDFIRFFYGIMYSRAEKKVSYRETKNFWSATQLHEAGVNFEQISRKGPLNVMFDNGVLKFPRLILDDETICLFRNIMAFEIYHYPLDTPILDYVGFIDSLIDTSNDIDLLVRKGMLDNRLGSSKAAANTVNNLCSGCKIYSSNAYFLSSFEALNAYLKQRRYKWRASLTRDYFTTPWRTASTIGALLLLLLTLIQTICSILSVITGSSGDGNA